MANEEKSIKIYRDFQFNFFSSLADFDFPRVFVFLYRDRWYSKWRSLGKKRMRMRKKPLTHLSGTHLSHVFVYMCVCASSDAICISG